MIPKRVTLKNFLSFGADEQTFDFTEDESLWILTGANGVGKSAVFDAITYCLFGQHRGGKDGAASLIRHGANGFRVVFDFEFNGVDYRITRTRGSNTTQRVERRDGEIWKAIPGINSVGEVGDWVELTLGLSFTAFTKSVLLRQGEADAIVEAKGSERLTILKRIIDVERFEDLSSRIGDATKQCRSRLDDSQQRRADMTEVTEEQVEEAKKTLQDAEEYRTAAQKALAGANKLVMLSTSWAKLDAELRQLEGQIRETESLLEDRDHIRAEKAHLDELADVVPILNQVIQLRSSLEESRDKEVRALASRQATSDEKAAHDSALSQAQQKGESHRTARDRFVQEARQLRTDIDRDSRFLSDADEMKQQESAEARFAATLDADLVRAKSAANAASEAAKAAGQHRAAAAGRLSPAKDEQARVAKLKTGARCSECGQEVTAEHAERERDRLAKQIAELESEVVAAKTAESEANRAFESAEELRRELDAKCAERIRIRDRVLALKATLDKVGVEADPVALRNSLEERTARAGTLEQNGKREQAALSEAETACNHLTTLRDSATKKLNVLEKECTALANAIASTGGQLTARVTSLPVGWAVRAESIAAAELAVHEAERKSLVDSRVQDLFDRLQKNEALRDERVRRRTEIEARIAAEIPEKARVPVSEAESQARAANRNASDAESARDRAKETAASLEDDRTAFTQLLADLAAAETAYDRHRKLHGWLGREGLLRELVRDAERDIVRFAQDTLKNLSGGDLDVELDHSQDDTEALKLLVKRSDDPHPIPVKFLSGSQKFRVAVAIAVAIGKFAAGTASARPLESVIIDEGFGSLDKDGLRAMREELENLKESQALKRVILVSHQEEFTSTFPIGYRLLAGKNGTVATRFRHSG